MLVHSFIPSSRVNGPGNRAVLWTAGCSLNCPGCWNPDTHAFDNSKEKDLDAVMKLIREAASASELLDGITFSGGEPMQQAPALYLLASLLKAELPNLSLGMFTGYSLKELEAGRFWWKSAYDGEKKPGSNLLWNQIKGMLDFAVMGRYVQKVRSSEKPLCGSLNQEVVFFSERYSEKDLLPQGVEITIDEEALVQITGFPVGMSV